MFFLNIQLVFFLEKKQMGNEKKTYLEINVNNIETKKIDGDDDGHSS